MRWQAGQSGNPKGRPRKGRAIADLLRETAESVTEGGLARKQAVVNKLWEMAEQGNLAAIKMIFEYLEGKPVARVEAELERKVKITADDLKYVMRELEAWEAEHPEPELVG